MHSRILFVMPERLCRASIFQWVTVWIPDQNRFGNDNLREHQMSSARRTVKGQGVLKCGARRGNYLDKLRLDCYFDIS
jgi:hypothetical protein